MRRLMVLLGLTAVFLMGCRQGAGYTFKGGELSPSKHAPGISLPDQHGQPFRLSAQGGNVVMLYFGYTNCLDLCPITLSDLKGVRQQLGKDADHLRVVMVTVDPARDTPPVLGRYLANFDPSFIGLTPPSPTLDALKRDYNIQADSSLPGGKMPTSMAMDATATAGANTAGTSYAVGHTSIVYVIDRSGQLRLAYPTGFPVKSMVDDVAYLLHNR
ncbi:MAG: SCO family protein [Herpetosiphonaceae bacterium]|nr:SCO family protein [Herpetosiphonaceae bacterium]